MELPPAQSAVVQAEAQKQVFILLIWILIFFFFLVESAVDVRAAAVRSGQIEELL